MLQIKDLHYSIGECRLLSGIDWVIHLGKRVALIGPNGAGKTTLFRIISGEIIPHQGNINMPKGLRIGYLPQEEIHLTGGTILQSVLEGQYDIAVLEKNIFELHKSLNSPHVNHDDLLEKLGTLEFRYEALGGYRLEVTAKSVLSGLGFSENDFFGNYSYYMEKREEEPKDISEAEAISEPKTPPQKKRSTRKSKEQKRLEAEARQTVSKERNQLEKEIESLEATIEELEAKKSDIEIRLVRPDTHQDGELVVSLQKEYAAVRQGIKKSYERWEKARIKLEEIINKISKVGNHRYEK